MPGIDPNLYPFVGLVALALCTASFRHWRRVRRLQAFIIVALIFLVAYFYLLPSKGPFVALGLAGLAGLLTVLLWP